MLKQKNRNRCTQNNECKGCGWGDESGSRWKSGEKMGIRKQEKRMREIKSLVQQPHTPTYLYAKSEQIPLSKTKSHLNGVD